MHACVAAACSFHCKTVGKGKLPVFCGPPTVSEPRKIGENAIILLTAAVAKAEKKRHKSIQMEGQAAVVSIETNKKRDTFRITATASSKTIFHNSL